MGGTSHPINWIQDNLVVRQFWELDVVGSSPAIQIMCGKPDVKTYFLDAYETQVCKLNTYYRPMSIAVFEQVLLQQQDMLYTA